MAYRYGNREQINLLPPSIEEYVGADDPVRVYDAFVDALDFNELGIIENEYAIGNIEYDPRSMLKILVYGYSYGYRSSRKLERALYHNLSFIWLTGGLRPDHKTIARFRKDHIDALQKILKQSVRLCIKLGLIEGNTLFVDGTKIKANASMKSIWTEKRCIEELVKIDKHIEEILRLCEKADNAEDSRDEYVTLTNELQNAKTLKDKVQSVLNELHKEEKAKINTVDRDSNIMKSRQGSLVGYNAQIVVDKKNGLIVNSDVSTDSNDQHQLTKQIAQANKNVGKECRYAVADAGYYNIAEIRKFDSTGISPIIPLPNSHQKDLRSDFVYDSKENCYWCPEGHRLNYRGKNIKTRQHSYCINNAKICQSCKRLAHCTNSKSGRWIKRHFDTGLIEKVEFLHVSNKNLFKLRKQKAELPFAHIKANMGLRAFLLRGIACVKAEMSLIANSYNMTRIISLFGANELCNVLRG